MHKVFDTPEVIGLHVELGSGHVTVRTEPVSQTTISIEGRDAEEVTVERRGEQILVIAPHRRGGFFSVSTDLTVLASVPSGSSLTTKLGSADLVALGRYESARVKSGSGDVHLDELGGEAVVDTGSGDIDIDCALASLRIKSGSGDVEVRRAAQDSVISTGSGDVSLGTTEQPAVVKSGSGHLRVADAHTDLTVSTASGDVTVEAIRRGALKAKGVSGDVTVGVRAGLPVWTDVGSVTGRISSNLQGGGRPGDGQEFVEIHATTVSGDIRLEQR